MKKIQVSMVDEMYNALDDYSKLYGVSMSALVNFLVRDGIEELETDKLIERCDGMSITEIIKSVFRSEGHR